MIKRLLSLLLILGPLTLLSEALPDNWAFRPLRKVELPELPKGKTSSHPIDRFVQARLADLGTKPRPEAESRVLLRRIYFDLTGLPPTPEEVNTFLHDKAPGAFERIVDRLLASPGYGERWARHWLDVVRFGESQGFEYDKIRDHAWRYRDYVINAFNSDKPYDQFIREQLAGDVIEPGTQDGIVATGFLVAGPWDQAGHSSASASVRGMVREAELEDMLGTIGQTFLGVTLNCARCHNHKFDPIPTRDYYRIKAVFQGVRHGERSIATREEERREQEALVRRKADLRELEARLSLLEREGRSRALTNSSTRSSDGTAALPITPFARWSFETDAKDSVGSLHAKLEEGGRIANGRLILDGKKAFARAEGLNTVLREKTFEAWVTLSTLDQGGGGIITLETEGSQNFDSIVYAERQSRRWMAGSEFYRRTHDLKTATEETDAPGDLIHVAISYHSDHTIALYRNGQPYGERYQWTNDFAPFDTFPPGSRVLFGQRHSGGSKTMFAGEIEEARIYDLALSADQVAASFKAGPDVGSIDKTQILAALAAPERKEHDELTQQRKAILAAMKVQTPPLQGYVAKPEKPGVTHVLHRGEPDKAREQVFAGALSAISASGGELSLGADTPEADRRRKFAEWVASPNNPLTARTIVNRIWHYHFGRGLSATPNDLGKMGDRPSDPALLDWLASWFVSPDGANWSLKKLHRLIVTSSAWRSSAQSNGDSGTSAAELAVYFSPRRLEAESLRDAMLAVSGELNLKMGGPGFRAFRHVGSGGQNEYFADDPIGPEFNRRTIYRLCVHSARDPLLDSLDCPEFSTRTAVRPSTTTPLQALSLMNNSFVQRQAKKLASHIEGTAGADLKKQIAALWLRCYAREPEPAELREAQALARDQGLESVAWAVLNSNEFVFVR